MGSGSGRFGWQRWSTDHQLWVELFALFNFAGLVVDIFLAHSTNQFRERSEYVPLVFSAAAAVVLAFGVAIREARPRLWRGIGYVVGWLAIAIGLAGVIL